MACLWLRREHWSLCSRRETSRSCDRHNGLSRNRLGFGHNILRVHNSVALVVSDVVDGELLAIGSSPSISSCDSPASYPGLRVVQLVRPVVVDGPGREG